MLPWLLIWGTILIGEFKKIIKMLKNSKLQFYISYMLYINNIFKTIKSILMFLNLFKKPVKSFDFRFSNLISR